MRYRDGVTVLSATDLSNHLGCHHRTALEMSAALGALAKPAFDDPQLEALFKRGLDHEHEYVSALVASGGTVVDLAKETDRTRAIDATHVAMRAGIDVIVQVALGDAEWYGRPDILKKVSRPSAFGDWSYEVEDTKLARDTKAGAILQLGLYSELLTAIQAVPPRAFRIVTPYGTHEYRVDDYAAYFRLIRSALSETTEQDAAVLAAANYPEPCDLCDICPWDGRCAAQRRADDHLSLVAGISRNQRQQLTANQVSTLTALATLPIDLSNVRQPLPFRPTRGAADTYVRVREQARLQLESRSLPTPKYEVLPIAAIVEGEEPEGLCRLPEPSPGDIFLDLEGDPFAGDIGAGGREYLFGFATMDGYTAVWAETQEQERQAFEQVMDLIQARKMAHPGMHVYHYAPYEPSGFKRLMSRYATREVELDSLLRSRTFIDLYAVARQSIRAGIERYSIKNLEPLYGFVRDVDLKEARRHLQAMELALEMNCVHELKPEVLVAVEGYNRDDCVSTLKLRDWLESVRAAEIARGQVIPRPVAKPGDASEALSLELQKIEGLRGQLLGVDDHGRYLLAYLLDWHRRESKAGWWEYFRLLALGDDDLLDEPGAVAGLEFVSEVERRKKSAVLRFSYPAQEMEIRRKDTLKLRSEKVWAEVVAVDRANWTIDVLVGPSKLDWRPSSAFAHDHVSTQVIEKAIFTIGEGVVAGTADPLAVHLLDRRPPRSQVVTELNGDVLAIQGPPGAGKTYTGGRMICDLIAAGKTVGITATGHKVIRNLLDAVHKEATDRAKNGQPGSAVRLGHKVGDEKVVTTADPVTAITDNAEALAMLTRGEINVLGATAWLWAREEFAKQVDVLFVDEAGQMSLANALAVTQAAKSLVLLGDPQQLEQPQKGSHPPGVEASVLQHVIGHTNGAPNRTMPPEQGIFLPETWRYGPAICDFTSEVFYEGKLRPTTQKALERQQLSGTAFAGAGLWVMDVPHEGNRNASDEEASAVARVVDNLLAPGSTWTDHEGATKPMAPSDILIVAPYNAHVGRLQERMSQLAAVASIGTVDKFQGREAPVVIYSMATSRPEDAPRGMEFLYSLNRLNVATSRAQCVAIVVASPRLFEPECRGPRQMQLASALCRFREMARPVTF
jgi:uncharacterized protein